MRILLPANVMPAGQKSGLRLPIFISRFFTPFPFQKKLLLIIAVMVCSLLNAQTDNDSQQVAYRKVIRERVSKIINTIGITDSNQYNKVLSIVMDQYFALNEVQEQSKTAIADIKKQSLSKEQADESIKKQQDQKALQLKQLHEKFISKLNTQLTGEQVDKIKDGMTYRVFPITYAAYEDMLPSLTAEQKSQIYNWLKEARELAMDEGSSEKKHEVFGKYKGRINNYLSAAGYDMKKEGQEWQKRIKEREAAKKSQDAH